MCVHLNIYFSFEINITGSRKKLVASVKYVKQLRVIRHNKRK